MHIIMQGAYSWGSGNPKIFDLQQELPQITILGLKIYETTDCLVFGTNGYRERCQQSETYIITERRTCIEKSQNIQSLTWKLALKNSGCTPVMCIVNIKISCEHVCTKSRRRGLVVINTYFDSTLYCCLLQSGSHCT